MRITSRGWRGAPARAFAGLPADVLVSAVGEAAVAADPGKGALDFPALGIDKAGDGKMALLGAGSSSANGAFASAWVEGNDGGNATAAQRRAQSGAGKAFVDEHAAHDLGFVARGERAGVIMVDAEFRKTDDNARYAAFAEERRRYRTLVGGDLHAEILRRQPAGSA